MAYREHTVKQGDCISSIAYKYGFFPDTIWNDSKNSKLKKDRKDPNVLLPGDVVYVREKEEKDESCASEQRHSFKRKGVPEKLILRFLVNDEPRADEAYVLEIDGELSEGKTDKNGKIEIPIPPNAKKGNVTFRDTGNKYELELGDMDPITELTGVQGRLRSLGFFDGKIDGKMSEELEQAIVAFQEANELDPTGNLNEDTRAKIKEAHGG